MSAKLQYRPASIDRNSLASSPSLDGADPVLSNIRKVQIDAEQICNNAADIEDARFLAENIVDTCRRILAADEGTVASSHADDGLHAERPFLGTPASTEPAVPPIDSSREASARARLNRLSARELEIFRHLAEGSSAADIAAKLSRSSKTINNHRTRILQKLGLKNATELVRLALQSGLVSV